MTNTQYRLQKMGQVLIGFENLRNAGELFYGAEACAIDDAIAAIERHINLVTIEDYEADNSK